MRVVYGEFPLTAPAFTSVLASPPSYLQPPVAGAFLFTAVNVLPASSLTGSSAAGGCCAVGPTDISYPDIALQVHPDLDPTATAHAAANWQLCFYIYI